MNTHEKKWSFQSDGIITTTPIVDGDKVIVATKSSCYMIDLNSGKEVWKFTGEENSVDAKDQYDYHSPSPLLYKESVIFTSKEGTIYTINKELGEVKWKYKGDGASDLLATPSIQDNILCFGDTKGNCYAMDLETQKTLWKKSIGKSYIYITFAYKDYAYFSGRDTVLKAFDLKQGGKKIFEQDMNTAVFSLPVIKDNIAYFGGVDGNLYSIKIK